MNVVAYELLFPDGRLDGEVPADGKIANGDATATANVVLNSLIEIGVDRMVGGKDAWVGVSRDFLLGGFATLLPPERFVLGILKDERPDEEMLAAVSELGQLGYRFALERFSYEPALESALEFAEFAKLDLQEQGREQFTADAERLQARGVKVMAENLESDVDHRFCVKSGAGLFHGCFYARPQTLEGGERVDANRVALLQLIATLQNQDVELEELERAIGADPRLSYRMLRYINSAFVGLHREVRSIRQAVVLMGIENLKRWSTLSLFTMVDNKPLELTRTALTRGRYCELAASDDLPASAKGELFTVGLLSVLDGLLDLPLKDVVSDMPLASDIADALVSHSGVYGGPLESVLALESGNLRRAESLVPEASMHYLEAIVWADAAASALTAA